MESKQVLLFQNENGDFVLLCPSCSKKYFNGALEIKFEMKKSETDINLNSTSSQVKMPIKPEASDPKSNSLLIKRDLSNCTK